MTADLLPTATAAQTWAAMRAMLRPHRLGIAAALGVLVAGTAVGMLTAPLLGRIVDIAARQQGTAALWPPVAGLAGVALGTAALGALGAVLIARIAEGMLADLRERFVDEVLRLPLARLERAGSGDLTARVTHDVTTVATAVRSALPELATSGLTIVLTLGGLAVLDWRFLVAALLAAPIQAHTVRWYVGRSGPLYARHRIAVGAQQQQLLDTIGGASTVRAFGLGERQVGRVTSRSRAAIDLALAAVGLQTRFYARLNLAEFVGLAAVLTTGFWLVGADAVSLGTATAAALYFHNLFDPVNVALRLVDEAQEAAASLARLVGVAQLETEEQATSGERATGAAAVELAGVGHAYRPGRPVLRDVDLTIPAGHRYALVGATGAGKSTLAMLVAGLHPVGTGTIRLAGGHRAGRDVVLVSQEVHVFAGPLADDLRLARPAARDDELRAALDVVGALAWTDALPDGLATVVGAGGHPLTATEAQQLALARLVLADPAVAILDEATAEAGSAGARVLEAAADRALAGRTGLVVAHRLTQAAAADRVVVLAGGRVVESCTHDELVAAGGPYAELWKAWSSRR